MPYKYCQVLQSILVTYFSHIHDSCSLQTARHTATEAAFEIVQALVKVINKVEQESKMASQQLEAQIKDGVS
jgi:hypothetical protein